MSSCNRLWKRCRNFEKTASKCTIRTYTEATYQNGSWAPGAPHDVLKKSCPQTFMHLRRAFLHYLCSHEWYDHLDARQKEKARVEAKVSMRAYAEFVESKLGIQFCTINLRMLTVHSYEQEIQTGPIKHALEFLVERAIQFWRRVGTVFGSDTQILPISTSPMHSARGNAQKYQSTA